MASMHAIQNAPWESRAARRADAVWGAATQPIETQELAIEQQDSMPKPEDGGDATEESLSPDDPRLHTDFRTPSVPVLMPSEPPTSVGVGVDPLPSDVQEAPSPTPDSDCPAFLSSSEDESPPRNITPWRSKSPASLGWVDDLSTPLRRHVETKAAEVVANFSPGEDHVSVSNLAEPAQVSTMPMQLSDIRIMESQEGATLLSAALATGGDGWVTEPNDAACIPPRPWVAQGHGSLDPYAGLPATPVAAPVAAPSCVTATTTPIRRKPRALFGFGGSSRKADYVNEEQSSIPAANWNANDDEEVDLIVDVADATARSASPHMPSHSAFVPVPDAADHHQGTANDGDPFGIPRSTLIFL